MKMLMIKMSDEEQEWGGEGAATRLDQKPVRDARQALDRMHLGKTSLFNPFSGNMQSAFKILLGLWLKLMMHYGGSVGLDAKRLPVAIRR